MSFSTIAGYGILFILFIICGHMIVSALLKPVKFIARKSGGTENFFVKALAAKEAYDMFKAATAPKNENNSEDTRNEATNERKIVQS